MQIPIKLEGRDKETVARFKSIMAFCTLMSHMTGLVFPWDWVMKRRHTIKEDL